LGQIRSKFSTIPIPGESVTLNGTALISEGKEQQEKLREELKTMLEKITYSKLAEQTANDAENLQKTVSKVPQNIFVG
jgi:N-acetylglutamate synthase/N-acetylornithine aminotransferase